MFHLVEPRSPVLVVGHDLDHVAELFVKLVPNLGLDLHGNDNASEVVSLV